MKPRLLADENTSHRLVAACRQIDSGFPLVHISDWRDGAYLSVKDPALLMTLRASAPASQLLMSSPRRFAYQRVVEMSARFWTAVALHRFLFSRGSPVLRSPAMQDGGWMCFASVKPRGATPLYGVKTPCSR